MSNIEVGTRVRAVREVKGFTPVPAGTTGTIVAAHTSGYTVEWDKAGLNKNSFDSTTGNRLLERVQIE